MEGNLLSRRDTVVSLVIIGVLFFIFGFVSWINAILIPYFKIACELTHFQSYLVALAFYISYLLISVPSSYLLKRTGFKKGMMIALWVMAAGAYMFVPAALSRTYGLFLTGLFFAGNRSCDYANRSQPLYNNTGIKGTGRPADQHHGHL